MPPINPRQCTVEFQTWPGLALTSALQMVLFANELPGIGDDFVHVARTIDPGLANAILLLLLVGLPSTLTHISYQKGVTHLDPEPFLAWVEGLEPRRLAAACAENSCLEVHRSHHEEVKSLEGSQSESPAMWALFQATQDQHNRARQLLKSPRQLSALAAETLRVFWEDHFRMLYARRSAAILATANTPRHRLPFDELPSFLEALLGRSMHLEGPWVEANSRFLLVPLPLMGPYVVLMDTTTPEATLLIGFDAERAVRLRATVELGPDLAILKALADETRLEILRFTGLSERFGGEIVTHLGISQPGVSRHLRLLTASGLLHVRQEGTSKFYSASHRGLDAIADAIRELTTQETGNRKEGQSEKGQDSME